MKMYCTGIHLFDTAFDICTSSSMVKITKFEPPFMLGLTRISEFGGIVKVLIKYDEGWRVDCVGADQKLAELVLQKTWNVPVLMNNLR